MDKCSRCKTEEKPLFRLKNLNMLVCSQCFASYYEKKVKNTVLKYGMLNGVRKLALAVSGGKDSMALARALLEVFPSIKFTIIHLNLGIPNYSDECQEIVEKFCKEYSIELLLYDLKKYNGYSIYDFGNIKSKKRMCGVCGTVKRYLMNKIAYENGFDTIATGHNLDDIVEILFNLYINGSIEELVRIKPVSSSTHSKIVRKIKPLIEMTDREDLYYAISRNLNYVSSECPLVKGSRMINRKKLILKIEEEIPNFKYLLLKTHLKRFLPMLEEYVLPPTLRECEDCGMPSINTVCSFCKLSSKILKLVENN
ncbi:MAG: adenine nucleotide alpha hydrolase family protein [Thaumarchaeota archaeon]|jgi:uncharacterized protein (TIGR00269 family)|nr:adenine nucleotide alpha hydrolase family protein [Candidatus Geocrenenecus arthurdayi]MCL7391493.1 adenine nucleotide alpha hydrolase family protein [Candidatus Geocrenenecus arthurdayi]MCL7402845.1 adenine nucleotide alpha hydrolase family protein [Candidatus Geocrenenecus arthurdayi]